MIEKTVATDWIFAGQVVFRRQHEVNIAVRLVAPLHHAVEVTSLFHVFSGVGPAGRALAGSALAAHCEPVATLETGTVCTLPAGCRPNLIKEQRLRARDHQCTIMQDEGLLWVVFAFQPMPPKRLVLAALDGHVQLLQLVVERNVLHLRLQVFHKFDGLLSVIFEELRIDCLSSLLLRSLAEIQRFWLHLVVEVHGTVLVLIPLRVPLLSIAPVEAERAREFLGRGALHQLGLRIICFEFLLHQWLPRFVEQQQACPAHCRCEVILAGAAALDFQDNVPVLCLWSLVSVHH
mmetsp:Transcript_47268/g.109378  ORF Transcript_47268/g.109378 Transcript_47268/m.109378 type:complete len:291 (+) Transcript_47268:1240-2112(+)